MSKLVVKTMVKSWENNIITCLENISYASNMLPYDSVTMFFLFFWLILLCFYYKYYCHQHNYYSSMMNTFDPDYPFGDLLEDYKFDKSSAYLPSKFHKKKSVNAMDKGNIPMHDLLFCCGW